MCNVDVMHFQMGEREYISSDLCLSCLDVTIFTEQAQFSWNT